ncbi:hypothetical protein ACLMJK_006705 [Lecanora helva]
MYTFKTLVLLPALTAFAVPVTDNAETKRADTITWPNNADVSSGDNTAHPDFWKRDEETVHPDFWKRDGEDVHPDFWKRESEDVHPDFWKRDGEDVHPDFWKRDDKTFHPDFWKRDEDVHPDFWKRDEDVHPDFWKRDGETVHPDFWKREEDVHPDFRKRDGETVHPDFWKRNEETVHPDFWKRKEDVAKPEPQFWKRYAPNHRVSISAEDKHQVWQRATAIEQPNLPEFIDTGACICGLLNIEDTLPHNGEVIEMWRCTASVDDDISKGSHGKWYNTTLPSQEVSGINKGREWDGNPPYLNETFVLVAEDGGAYYEVLDAANAEYALLGGDVNCTGSKDQAASAAFYASQS